jgi:hypothetical protein
MKLHLIFTNYPFQLQLPITFPIHAIQVYDVCSDFIKNENIHEHFLSPFEVGTITDNVEKHVNRASLVEGIYFAVINSKTAEKISMGHHKTFFIKSRSSKDD